MYIIVLFEHKTKKQNKEHEDRVRQTLLFCFVLLFLFCQEGCKKMWTYLTLAAKQLLPNFVKYAEAQSLPDAALVF